MAGNQRLRSLAEQVSPADEFSLCMRLKLLSDEVFLPFKCFARLHRLLQQGSSAPRD